MRVLRSRFILSVYFLVWCLGVGILGVSAQGTPEILTIPQNKTGTLSPAAPTALYIFQVLQPQSVTIQVLSLEPTMVPAFTLFDPAGVALQTQTGTSGIAQATVGLTSSGNYTLQIQSVSAGVGGFVVSLMGGATTEVLREPLTLGQVTDGQVDAETPLAAYTLVGSPTDALYLYVQPPPTSSFSPAVTLKDVATDQTLAISSPALGGVRYRLAPSSDTLEVLIGYGNHAPTEPFRICFGRLSGPGSCNLEGAVVAVVPTLISVAPTAIPTRFVPVSIPATAPCAVVSAQGATINVRSAPNTNSAIVTRLLPTSFAPVIGRLPDNSWYYVNISGVVGWISAAVVFPGGVCNTVPGVTPTAGPTAVVTSLPTFTPTPSPTTAGPTATATATATATTGAPLQLNFGLPPTYGATTLTSGFTPDPFTAGITAGGPVDVTYLGGGCVGFAAQAPDFSVTYTAGSFPTLRFFFVGPAGSDTSMVINGPSGSFFCNDDSFGTLNPTIDFSTPASGRYDVWIANVGSGGFGTLSVTENTGLNP